MNAQLNFEPIDMGKWERREHFYYFTQMTNVGFTISTEINVSALRAKIKEKSLKFYPAYLWIVTTVLNKYKEFRTAFYDEKIGYWSSLTPAYAIFHDADKTFSYLWTEYNEDFKAFYQNYLDDIAKYGQNLGILSKPNPIPNCYTISMIPWIAFTGFVLQNYKESKHYLPTIEAGRFIEKDGQSYMPLSITVHHAVCDGYHVSLLIDGIQQICNGSDSWLK